MRLPQAPLASADTQVVQRLLEQSRIPSKAILITGLGDAIKLSGFDVDRILRDDELLNDEVMNGWAALLTKFGPQDYHVAQTYLYTRAAGDMDGADSHLIARLAVSTMGIVGTAASDGFRQSKQVLPTLSLDIFALRKWLIPAHLNGNHWALIVVDFDRKTINYCDSLYRSGAGEAECEVRAFTP